jgi:Clp amino terminal domain, pathogenicity island component
MDAAPAELRLVSLESLIAAVSAARPDALDQISEAMVVAEHLDRTGDDLIGHFVEQARSQGITWSDIGQSMGVSKQAAQKRFSARGGDDDLEPLDPSQGFARFAVEARNILVAAHDAARTRQEPTVTAARLVLALGDTPLLTALDVDADHLRATFEPALPPAGDAQLEIVPYAEDARGALEAAFREALRLDADMVEPRHVLLGLLLVDDLGDRLAKHGITAGRVETWDAAG